MAAVTSSSPGLNNAPIVEATCDALSLPKLKGDYGNQREETGKENEGTHPMAQFAAGFKSERLRLMCLGKLTSSLLPGFKRWHTPLVSCERPVAPQPARNRTRLAMHYSPQRASVGLGLHSNNKKGDVGGKSSAL
jgi:hypothetical protein